MNLTENHILIGLGGTGGKILKAFRKRLFAEFDADERNQLPIGFVYVDSTTEMMQPGDVTFRVHGQDASFTRSEFVNIKGVELDTVFKNPSGFPGLKGFIGDPEVMQKTVGSVGAAAGQKRKAGRILFGGSVQSYLDTLGTQYEKVKKISSNSMLMIHIFTGLAGGTGSGSIIDVIAQTRRKFPEIINNDRTSGTDIVVYCMTPEIDPPAGCEAGRYHANGYAALTEINALLVKKYKPHDVTGMSDRINVSTKQIANGVYVYSNINEHGKVVDSHRQLPLIVADFAYSRIFLENNDNTAQFLRSYSFENIDPYLFENSEKAKQDQIDIVRSKTFGSFGIKRVIIPEEEIIEYFTYSFGQQALLQIRYNHWNDDLGFRDTPSNVDFNSFVKEKEQLERWRISDRHLTLDKPILKSDEKKFPGFADYWNSVIPNWTEIARADKLPLNKLEQCCAEGYEKLFRKAGVKAFFEGKTQAKEEHASEIAELIELYLFDQWQTGDLSLHNLTQLIDKLIESLEQRRKELEGRIQQWNQSVDQLENARALSQLDWSSVGFLSGDILGKKKKILQQHSTIMNQLYLKKTEVEGLQFGVAVLAALSIKLNALRGRIEKFVNTVNAALDDVAKQIGARCQDNGAINLQETIIRYYNKDAVVKFTKEVIRDKKRQANIAGAFREEIISQTGSEHTFARANAVVSSDTVLQILDTLIREKSVVIHDEILIENNEKLINRSILEQLSEQFRTEDDLKKFATDLISQSGVFAVFNATEINRAVNNNPIPVVGTSVFIKRILINLPKIEGNENVQRFADRLKRALTESVQGNAVVYVDTNGLRKNEITVSSITYCFPLRAVNDLKYLKEKYDYLVSNPNEARQNRTVLHTEGSGEMFPDLFVAAEMLPSDIRRQYVPYLIAANVLGFVKYADREDGTGKSAWGTISINRMGEEVLNPVSDKFTDIPFNSEFFTESFGEELREKTEKEIRENYLHKDRRSELVKKIQNLYREIILPEYNNNKGNSDCKFFAECAEKAMDLIEKV
ncbi:MAG: tubulin-like doman-containing protein [Prevotellaceae bacterium]|jgi:hypothetical protein|nr:tubulin-like doman-containing protein [Prevotellaceae bacterium]